MKNVRLSESVIDNLRIIKALTGVKSISAVIEPFAKNEVVDLYLRYENLENAYIDNDIGQKLACMNMSYMKTSSSGIDVYFYNDELITVNDGDDLFVKLEDFVTYDNEILVTDKITKADWNILIEIIPELKDQ